MGKKIEVKHIDLSSIKTPDFVKDMTYQDLDMLANDIRKNILDNVSKKGGHLSANLGVVEATIALCRCFDFSKDKLIFDVGHQCYTYKILTGRSLEHLNDKGGISGFQKMKESAYDHFEAGHSSTSISIANGMALARDLKHETYDVVAFVGDASIANGLAFEGLNSLAQGHHKAIIILNDNGMSIAPPSGGLSKVFRKLSTSSFYRKSKNFSKRVFGITKLGNKILSGLGSFKNWFKSRFIGFNAFDSMGYKVIGPIDGNNIKKMENALIRAKRQERSTIVYIKTRKGLGYKYAEEDKLGVWHGVNAFDLETGKPLSSGEDTSWCKVFSNETDRQMEANKDLVFIIPAMQIGGKMTNIINKYKSRSIDVGIAEEHAMTMAGGISANGLHPIVSIYSTFMQRAYDEISHDICRTEQNATLLVDRSGLIGNPGSSHQGFFDETILIGMPNTVVTMPSNSGQVNALFKDSLNKHGVFAIRYPLGNANIAENEEVPFGYWKEELKGEKIAIVSVGPLTEQLKEAIISNNKKVTLLNAIYQKPINEQKVDELLKYNKVIIYDAYGTEDGFAQLLLRSLVKKSYKGEIVIKTLPCAFVEHATIAEQLEDLHLTVNDILKLI